MSSMTSRISPPCLCYCLRQKSPVVLYFIYCSVRPWSAVAEYTIKEVFLSLLIFYFTRPCSEVCFLKSDCCSGLKEFPLFWEIWESESAFQQVLSPAHCISLDVPWVFRAAWGLHVYNHKCEVLCCKRNSKWHATILCWKIERKGWVKFTWLCLDGLSDLLKLFSSLFSLSLWLTHAITCAFCVCFTPMSSCKSFPVRSFSWAQTLWEKKKKRGEPVKSVLHVSTVPFPLSLIELEMTDEKRLKVLDECVSHFNELLWSQREGKGRETCVQRWWTRYRSIILLVCRSHCREV